MAGLRFLSELVRLANHEGVERIPCIELVIAALKVQLRLLQTAGRRRRLDGLFLRADVLDLRVRGAHLVEHRLDDLAVGAGQDLAEDGTRNLDEQGIALVPVKAGRLKPGGEGVNADPGFHEV